MQINVKTSMLLVRQAGHEAFGVNIIPRFATPGHIAVCAAEKGSCGRLLLGRSGTGLVSN